MPVEQYLNEPGVKRLNAIRRMVEQLPCPKDIIVKATLCPSYSGCFFPNLSSPFHCEGDQMVDQDCQNLMLRGQSQTSGRTFASSAIVVLQFNPDQRSGWVYTYRGSTYHFFLE
jgi:hypothetical protein